MPIHSVSSFYITHRKHEKLTFIEIYYKQIWDNLRASKSLLGSLFLALRTTLALMRRCVRSWRAVRRGSNDNGRRLSSEDYASIARAQWLPILIHWPTSDFTGTASRGTVARHT